MSTDEQDRQMLREVHAAIVGNEPLGYKGLAVRMSEAEGQIAAHNKKFLTFAGIFTGASIVLGYVKARLAELGG